MDEKVQKFPEQTPRVESGAVQFGSDWPGLFLRGDNALAVANAIDVALSLVPSDTRQTILLMLSPLSSVRDLIYRDVKIGNYVAGMVNPESTYPKQGGKS